MTGKNNVRDIFMGSNVFNNANFSDWEMNLRLSWDPRGFSILQRDLLGLSQDLIRIVEIEFWKTHSDDNMTAQSIMLAGMTQQFRRQNKGLDPYELLAKLHDLHRSNIRSQRYELQKKLFRARMSEGTSVEHHVSQMITDIEQLGQLGIVFEAETSIDLILQSLPDSWSGFIMNYNMINQEHTLGELMSTLHEAENELLKSKKREAYFTSTSHSSRAWPRIDICRVDLVSIA